MSESVAIFHRCSPNLATKVDSQEMWLPIVLVDILNISVPHVPPKPLFGENLQLKPMESVESVSAYFLTTDKAIVTKLDQTIEEIELYKKLEFRDKGGVTRVT